MSKIAFPSIIFRGGLIVTLVLPGLSAGLTTPLRTLAQGDTMSSTACDSRNPYNLKADTHTKFRVQLNWDVCNKYKNDFYQISWNLADDKEKIVKINDTNAHGWLLNRARDESQYTFKVRGCNNVSGQQPDCTPWTTLTVSTPDWD